MTATVCSWDHPGEARFTGTVASAIVAYRLPIATQTALIDAWERRQFDDIVVIDRDSVRGQRGEYAPGLRRMNFGSAGRICDRVTRAGWAPDHVETAAVVCADSTCIAVPAVCGNVSLIDRVRRGAVLPAAAYMDDADVIPAGPIGTGPYIAPIALATAPIADSGGVYAGGSWGAAAGFGYAIDQRQTALCECVPTPPCPVAAVPEPSTLSLLICGLAAVAAGWVKKSIQSAPSSFSATKGEDDDDESDSRRACRMAGEGYGRGTRSGWQGRSGDVDDGRAEHAAGLLRPLSPRATHQGNAEPKLTPVAAGLVGVIVAGRAKA